MATVPSHDDSAPAVPSTALIDPLEVLERAPLTFHVRTRRQIVAALVVCCVVYFTAARVLHHLDLLHGWVVLGLGFFWPIVAALILRRIRRRGSEDGLAS